jgi:membrane protease YdiL (CAAX protease family)
MPRPGRWIPVAALGAYNLIQNLLVPPNGYVPANVGVGVILVGLARRQGCSWDDLGLSRTGWKRGLIIGVAGAAVTAGAAEKAATNPASHPYLLDARARNQSRRDSWYRAMVRFPIGTALFEEVAFRGVIYGMWRRSGTSHRMATTATAVAFGAWHLIPSLNALTGNPLGNRLNSRSATAGVAVVGALATGISSLGLTWLRRKSGSLIAPWLIHSAFNAAGYLAGVGAWRRGSSMQEKSDPRP